MSNKIVFKVFTDSKKKSSSQSNQQQAQAQAKKSAPKPVEPKINKDEEERRKRLEAEKKAALEKKRASFAAAKETILDEEEKKKARILQDLFELKTLAEVPAYCSSIMNDRTIRYDSILQIPEIAKICSDWTDVVTLAKYCYNLKFIQDDYDSVLIDYEAPNLFGCIARIACQLSDLPEKMSAGDLRMELGTYPLYINKKPNSKVAQILFRDGIVKVSQFFKTKTTNVKKMVDGEMKIVAEPYKISTIILKDEHKKPLYSPCVTNENGNDLWLDDGPIM